MKTRDIDAAIKAISKAKTKIQLMNEKYPQMYKDELEEVGKHVISEWYSKYSPFVYDRNLGLYDAFEVQLDGLDYYVNFDSDLLDDVYHQSVDWIYENSFVKGYHGGSSKGKGHPVPGIPYWRRPTPLFIEWGAPAKYSFSPYLIMVNRMKNKIKEIDKKKQNEYDKIMEKVKIAIDRI